MKKMTCGFLLAIILLCGSAMHTSAEPVGKGGARGAFMKGDNTLGFSLGLGHPHSYYGGSTYLPAFIMNYDHGIVDNVGPGTIGIGGLLGWQSSAYKYNSGHKSTLTNFVIGFRGTYHLTILKDKNNKFDPYGGLTIGMRIESHNNDAPGHNHEEYGGAYPFFGPFIGAKYNFVPQFGAFSELGYDIAFFKIGIHVNF